jgi:hypothetical protein
MMMIKPYMMISNNHQFYGYSCGLDCSDCKRAKLKKQPDCSQFIVSNLYEDYC